LIWARDGKPGGMGKFTEHFGIEMENLYREQLKKIEKCDTLVGIIRKLE